MVESLEDCRRAFDGKLVLYSNSAGLQQFDPEGGWRIVTCAVMRPAALARKTTVGVPVPVPAPLKHDSRGVLA